MVMQASNENGTAIWISIGDITVSDKYQMRVKLDTDTVMEYCELIEMAETPWPFLAPCVVYQVGDQKILVDGFHRLRAMEMAQKDQLFVTVITGTEDDAVEAALSVNATHGLRLSNADKRHKVVIALGVPRLEELSDRMLAELCGVSDFLISTIRAELRGYSSSERKTNMGADGRHRPASKGAAASQRIAIAEAIEASDGNSDRQIAVKVGCSDKTVAKVRRETQAATSVVVASKDETPESSVNLQRAEDAPSDPPISDTEAAKAAIQAILSGLSVHDKENVVTSLLQSHRPKGDESTQPGDYLPDLPCDLAGAVKLVSKEFKDRVDSLLKVSGWAVIWNGEYSKSLLESIQNQLKRITVRAGLRIEPGVKRASIKFPVALDNEAFRKQWDNHLEDREKRNIPTLPEIQKAHLMTLSRFDAQQAKQILGHCIMKQWTDLPDYVDLADEEWCGRPPAFPPEDTADVRDAVLQTGHA